MPVRVSVILPAYNVAPYVEEAIRSVLAQRGVPFELLIGDDASTDESWDRIRRYLPDPRVRAWRFRKHRGIGATRNLLHARAKGAYLSVCDADDRMLPGNLRRLSSALDRWPRAGLVYGRRKIMDAAGRSLKDRWYFQPRPRMDWDLLRMPAPHPGALIRKRCMDRVGGYDPSFLIAGDWDLFLRLAEVAEFRFVEGPPVYLYRIRPDSTIHGKSDRLGRQVARRVLRKAILRRYGLRVRW